MSYVVRFLMLGFKFYWHSAMSEIMNLLIVLIYLIILETAFLFDGMKVSKVFFNLLTPFRTTKVYIKYIPLQSSCSIF